MESIVRLASLTISNIKNVRNGQIIMPNTYRKHLSYRNAEVLGVYGQNGSGKTAVIDALYYLHRIMIGHPLEDKIVDYIDAKSDCGEISANFNIFTEDVIYTESWGPKYNNRQIVKHWFQEWNTRGKVVAWEIKQFFHKGNQTIVEWYFKNEMNNGSIEEFDGISLVEWTKDNKIKSLKEFGCNLNNYNPYEHSDLPEFRDERASWF